MLMKLTQAFFAQKCYISFSPIFGLKNIGKKVARVILMKLTTVWLDLDIPVSWTNEMGQVNMHNVTSSEGKLNLLSL